MKTFCKSILKAKLFYILTLFLLIPATSLAVDMDELVEQYGKDMVIFEVSKISGSRMSYSINGKFKRKFRPSNENINAVTLQRDLDYYNYPIEKLESKLKKLSSITGKHSDITMIRQKVEEEKSKIFQEKQRKENEIKLEKERLRQKKEADYREARRIRREYLTKGSVICTTFSYIEEYSKNYQLDMLNDLGGCLKTGKILRYNCVDEISDYTKIRLIEVKGYPTVWVQSYVIDCSKQRY